MAGLTPEQLIALECLLAGQTQGTASKKAGVSPRTLYQWMHTNDAFQRAYGEACDRLHRANVAAIQKAQQSSTEKLVKIVRSSKKEENVIRAAIALTELGFKAAEHFRFDERLRKAEERNASNTGEPTPGDRIDRQPEHDAGAAEPGSGVLPGATG
jgi:hypothetical protein